MGGMAKKLKPQKPEAKLPVDPNAPTFQAGDEIVVQRHNVLWFGYRGTILSVDGGMCRVKIGRFARSPQTFPADIPAAELRLDI